MQSENAKPEYPLAIYRFYNLKDLIFEIHNTNFINLHIFV